VCVGGWVYKHTHIHAHMYMCCMCVCAHVRVSHTHTHTHTHTHRRVRSGVEGRLPLQTPPQQKAKNNTHPNTEPKKIHLQRSMV